MDADIIYHGWIEFATEIPNSKSWIKMSSKKGWKRKFMVLSKLIEDEDKIYLSAYEKEDNWKNTEAKKTLSLYPRYKIAKRNDIKGKDNVLEVSNEEEKWYLANDKSKIIDLWANQIQMQTKLSRVISGRIFMVSGTVSKPMQRIGASQQRCLLHITKWGLTLALQDSRSILALWPLTTIRNYEYSGQCQFTIETGRRSPMGEGVYMFNTNIGQDEEIFKVIDAFVSASINERNLVNSNRTGPVSDEEILKNYDELHLTATGMATSSFINPPNYNRLERRSTPPPPREHGALPLPPRNPNPSPFSREPSLHKPPEYNHLFQHQEDGGLANFSYPDSYDQLDRKLSTLKSADVVDLPHDSYDSLNKRDISKEIKGRVDRKRNDYDHIDFNSSRSLPKKGDVDVAGYPLRDEPSIPYLDDDNEIPFTGRKNLSSSVSSNKSDQYEYRNTLYTSMNDPESIDSSNASFSSTACLLRNDSVSSDVLKNDSAIRGLTRNDSEASGISLSPRGHPTRVSSSIKNKPIQDIANHFLYQLPPAPLKKINSKEGETTEVENENEELYENGQTVAENESAT